jgi:hypothetical protein
VSARDSELDDGSRGYDPDLSSVATSPSQLPPDDQRVRRALFTLRESAAYLDVPASTLHQWARPSDGPGLITIFPRAGRSATVPFVGFAEAYVLSALRHAGVPMQRIRPAVARLSEECGGARVEDLVDRFRSGDSVADIAEDFDVPQDEVEDVIRVATRLAA